MVSTGSDLTLADRSIVTSRLIDAPRELVFAAWTDAARIGRWFGPDGFTTTTEQMDVRPGGVWRFVMHGPDGVDYSNLVVYTEITPPERLSYDHSDGDGSDTFHNTITFADEGGKTLLTMTAVLASAEDRKRVAEEHGAIEGGKQTLARLAAYVEAQA